jgi:hypothetical protein
MAHMKKEHMKKEKMMKKEHMSATPLSISSRKWVENARLHASKHEAPHHHRIQG